MIGTNEIFNFDGYTNFRCNVIIPINFSLCSYRLPTDFRKIGKLKDEKRCLDNFASVFSSASFQSYLQYRSLIGLLKFHPEKDTHTEDKDYRRTKLTKHSRYNTFRFFSEIIQFQSNKNGAMFIKSNSVQDWQLLFI